jgi:hypothetical protein
MCRTRWVTHQNALASAVGSPCIPFTTCELRTTSKFFLAQSSPALSASCFRSASLVILLLSRDLEANGSLNEYYHPDTGAALSHKGFMDWNLLVLEMI